MLINYTNHPIEEWPKSQVNKAKKLFTNIIDFPFPPIGPYYSEEKIQLLAKKMVQECLKLLPENEKNGIHIMGEYNFTFAFVTYAKTKGIRCVSSTKDRNGEIIVKGKKKYPFVKFRDY